jgi:hypothetical protein
MNLPLNDEFSYFWPRNNTTTTTTTTTSSMTSSTSSPSSQNQTPLPNQSNHQSIYEPWSSYYNNTYSNNTTNTPPSNTQPLESNVSSSLNNNSSNYTNGYENGTNWSTSNPSIYSNHHQTYNQANYASSVKSNQYNNGFYSSPDLNDANSNRLQIIQNDSSKLNNNNKSTKSSTSINFSYLIFETRNLCETLIIC